jgi:hypothetical protein
MIARSSRALGLFVGLALAPACAPEPSPAAPPAPAPAPAAPAPAPAEAVAPAPAPVVEAAPTPAPAEAPAFDATTATALRVKIVAIPNRKSWVPCGVKHSIGALEVEVQNVGEPPPRMLLFVSCPVGGRHGASLVVGAVLDVTLHTRKQSWPSVAGLSQDLPRRQVASFVAAPVESK